MHEGVCYWLIPQSHIDDDFCLSQVEQLLGHAANVAAYSCSRKTPFDLACEFGHEQVCCLQYVISSNSFQAPKCQIFILKLAVMTYSAFLLQCFYSMWTREHYRISPSRLLAEFHKRRLNQCSFVLLYFVLFTLLSCIQFVFSCIVLFVSISQVTDYEDRL